MKYMILLFFLGITFHINSQNFDAERVKTMISKFKADDRGPYKDIRWFCKEGTFKPPNEKCDQPGAVQRARYKDEIIALATQHHIFLGQILSTTDFTEFLDESNSFSRLKQFQLEKHLRNIDDGWIQRKAQFYRGAYQVEDEEDWGLHFLEWACNSDELIKKDYYVLRQAVKDIPHKAQDSKTIRIRTLAKVISDDYPRFMNLRVKIHGLPDSSDLGKVKIFKENNKGFLNQKLIMSFDELISIMKDYYLTSNLNELDIQLNQLSKNTSAEISFLNNLKGYQHMPNGKPRAMMLAEILLEIREIQIHEISGKTKLALFDIQNFLEELFFIEIQLWTPTTLGELMDKICYSGMAATGTGYLELWEWESLINELNRSNIHHFNLDEINDFFVAARKVVEWGTGTIRTQYFEVYNLFKSFEPLAMDFIDVKVRSSALLFLGNSVSKMGDIIAKEAELSNDVLNIENQSSIRGLNPGIAKGQLMVIEDDAEKIEVHSGKIYIFHNPPADLKPIAGIATVSEGNLVSHVQLLARNLGIPNAVISNQNLESLRKYHEKEVFYAVSPSGNVIMKPVHQMDSIENKLFEKSPRSKQKVTVDIDKIDFNQPMVLNLNTVNSEYSGKICGPKAANLGHLKFLFPEHVVDGLVLPFSVFKFHMDQKIPSLELSYWDHLQETFKLAEEKRFKEESEESIEQFTIDRLNDLRTLISDMKLDTDFVSELEEKFTEIFGKQLGEIPVFLRSDTNMEDLKDFTGAGLNLTLFNVLDKKKILQGILDVWASPYTERSFKWRQSFLSNPENVFPSILIIPSVDVESSGVLITKGLPSGNINDLTIAFSRGAGGAVDGQIAESYLLINNGQNVLINPSREIRFKTLPLTGGILNKQTSFEEPILKTEDLHKLRSISKKIVTQLKTDSKYNFNGPHDIELGFLDGHIWLFQIRPFVENKMADNLSYLESISNGLPLNKDISLTLKINQN